MPKIEFAGLPFNFGPQNHLGMTRDDVCLITLEKYTGPAETDPAVRARARVEGDLPADQEGLHRSRPPRAADAGGEPARAARVHAADPRRELGHAVHEAAARRARQHRHDDRRVQDPLTANGMGETVQAIKYALTIGSVYALVAVGYSLIFSTTRIVNFAQGTLVVVGGYLGWWMYARVFDGSVPILVVLLLVLVVTALVGLLFDFVAIEPLGQFDPVTNIGWLVTTFAAAIVVQEIVSKKISDTGQTLPDLVRSIVGWKGSVVSDVAIGPSDILLVLVTVTLVIALELFQSRTPCRPCVSCRRTGPAGRIADGREPARDGPLELHDRGRAHRTVGRAHRAALRCALQHRAQPRRRGLRRGRDRRARIDARCDRRRLSRGGGRGDRRGVLRPCRHVPTDHGLRVVRARAHACGRPDCSAARSWKRCSRARGYHHANRTRRRVGAANGRARRLPVVVRQRAGPATGTGCRSASRPCGSRRR